ncbi:MAG TPA: tRNA guanosine(34) transglycosylase Tgt [Candidatus Krumholzibacteria bacterium]|nr:tRNA guanosine(34) transglycosylase Tgt [Candidatus Krumholzibacteria bacterium]
MSGFSFEVLATDGAARRGRLHTDHGIVETPVFMPVGTQATVKGLTVDQLASTGARMILANTYHLYLRPTHQRIQELGGLHRFMAYDGSMLTDSGGFQVFSLSDLNRLSEEGVRFRSHLDGSEHFLSPESSMEIQAALGADVVMAFDHCVALPASEQLVEEAVSRTTRWAQRCLKAFGPRRRNEAGHEQVLFGIMQGGVSKSQRERSARQLTALDFPGYAIGGLSVGESKEDLHRLSAFSAALLPQEKPRYLMGVGFPEDILAAVEGGVDMFDCVLPTRMARNGTLMTHEGRLALRNARFASDERPLEEGCSCLSCRKHTRAYLRHLIIAGEILGPVLCTLHNLTFYQTLMSEIRQAVQKGALAEYRTSFLTRYQAENGRVP